MSGPHFYVYRFRDGCYLYDRTCGTETAARERVRELGDRAVYLVDHLIRGGYY